MMSFQFLLQAVGILPLSVNINIQTMDLLKKCVITNSLARLFYCGLLCSCDSSNTVVSKFIYLFLFIYLYSKYINI